MKLFRRPEGRFAIEALAIVAAAAVPGYLHVGWKRVLALVVVVLVVSVLVELLAAIGSRRRRKRAQPDEVLDLVQAEPVVAPEPEVVPLPPPPPPPTPVALPPKPVPPKPAPPKPQRPQPQPPERRPPATPAARPGGPGPPPEQELSRIAEFFTPGPVPAPPVARPRPRPAAPTRAASRRWKLADLERAVRAAAAPDQELVYMVGYLRDYAAPDGTLPPEFDTLVQDAFGPLLGRMSREP